MRPVLRTLAPALLALALAAAHARAQDPTARPDTLGAGVVRVCTGGDVTLGTNLDPGWAQSASRKYGMRVDPFPDPDSLLAPLRPLVADADVVLLNVEGAIGEGTPARRKCAPGSTACFAFRQPVGTAAALRRVVDPDSAAVVGNVANNHAGDAGRPGWRDTMRHLEAAGVHVTGADSVPTAVATARGDTVAFLGFSVWIGPDARDLAAVRRIVGRAAERYERVVVTMHMGAEGRAAQRTPDARETFYGENRGNMVAFARAAAAAGADLVVGHGPHVMRAAEWQGKTLILYSLGNLLTYGPFSLAEPLNRGAVACAALDSTGRVVEAALRPTRQVPPGRLRADLTARSAALTDSLSRLDFPETGARIDPDGTIHLPDAGAEPGWAAPRRPRPVRRGPAGRGRGARPRRGCRHGRRFSSCTPHPFPPTGPMTRRLASALLASLLVLLSAGACAAAPRPASASARHAPSDTAALRRALEAAMQGYAGVAGVSVRNLRTGESLSIRGGETYPAASLVKVPVLVALLDQVNRGGIRLDERMGMIARDRVGGSGVLQFMESGLPLTVGDAAWLMITLSDNTATNLLLDKINIKTVWEKMDSLGLPHTRIHSKTFIRATSLAPDSSVKYGLGVAVPDEMVRLFALLHEGRAVSPALDSLAIRMLRANQDGSKLVRWLPQDVPVAHKSGDVDRARNDCGIIYGPDAPVAVCVMTRENQETTYAVDAPAHLLIGRVGREVFRHYNPSAQLPPLPAR